MDGLLNGQAAILLVWIIADVLSGEALVGRASFSTTVQVSDNELLTPATLVTARGLKEQELLGAPRLRGTFTNRTGKEWL
jgi:hypothetical protein